MLKLLYDHYLGGVPPVPCVSVDNIPAVALDNGLTQNLKTLFLDPNPDIVTCQNLLFETILKSGYTIGFGYRINEMFEKCRLGCCLPCVGIV